MSTVTRKADGFEVDAATLAAAFRLDIDTVRDRMRAGEITSRCESGIDADAGRFRLIFRYQARALRLTVDSGGNVLSRATYDVTARRAPSR